MAFGRQTERQSEPLLSWSELPRSQGRPFYDRLQGKGPPLPSAPPLWAGLPSSPQARDTPQRPRVSVRDFGTQTTPNYGERTGRAKKRPLFGFGRLVTGLLRAVMTGLLAIGDRLEQS